MTLLEEKQVTDWHGVCRSCGKVGDGHTLHCRTLRLAPGWYERSEWELPGDPYATEWERSNG